MRVESLALQCATLQTSRTLRPESTTTRALEYVHSSPGINNIEMYTENIYGSIDLIPGPLCILIGLSRCFVQRSSAIETSNSHAMSSSKALTERQMTEAVHMVCLGRSYLQVMRIREPRATGLVFSSGKLVVTGATGVEAAEEAARKFVAVVKSLTLKPQFL